MRSIYLMSSDIYNLFIITIGGIEKHMQLFAKGKKLFQVEAGVTEKMRV